MLLQNRTSTLGTHTQIGPGTRIQDYAELRGSVIGAECIIGPRVTIENSVIWDDVEIGEGTVIINSIIANGVRIGPMGRVERGCLIGENTILGKNASLPQFCKVGSRPPASDEDWDEDNDEEDAHVWRISDCECVLALNCLVLLPRLTQISANVIGTPDSEAPALEVYRWPHEDEEAGLNPEDNDENERETVRSRMYNRLGTCRLQLSARR